MTNARDIEARAAEWLGRKDRADWSRADQAALDRWLAEATGHEVAYLRLATVWDKADRLAERGGGDRLPRTRPRWAVPASLAAGLAATVAGVWLYVGHNGVVHTTIVGQHEDVALSDGSRVALNTDTRMVAAIDGGGREAWLDHGEAYFEIAHDPAHPFVVHAGKYAITVLGTKFLVRQEGERLRVAVTQGRVRLASIASHAETPVLLTRGEVATAAGDDVLVSTETPERAADNLAWRHGALVFRRVTLADAAAEINRYTDRKILIADDAAKGIRIGGRFTVHNTEGFTRLLQSGLNLTVTYRPDAIIISS